MSFYSSEVFVLDIWIYDENVIKESAKKYAPYCDMIVEKCDSSKVQITITVNEKYKDYEEHIKGELLNYILGHSILIKEG